MKLFAPLAQIMPACWLLAALMFCESAAVAQVVYTVQSPTPVISYGDGSAPIPVPNTAIKPASVNGKEGKEGGEESESLKKFKQLKFDRRPSTILKTWLELREEADKKTNKKDVPAETEEEVTEAAEQPTKNDLPEATEEVEAKAETKTKVEEDSSAKGEQESTTSTAELSDDDKKAEAKKAAEKAKQEAQRKKAENEKIEKEQKVFQRDVTLGQWDQAKTYLNTFKDKEAEAAYQYLLTSLASGSPEANEQMQMAIQSLPPSMRQVAQQASGHQETNKFDFDDILALASLQPGKHDKKSLQSLSAIVRHALKQGHTIELLINKLEHSISGDPPEITRREAAKILAGASQAEKMGNFLPSVDEAAKNNDREGLNLLAQHFLALHGKDRDQKNLVAAWEATLAALAAGDIEEEEKKTALTRAVDLATQVHDDLGEAWLKESFTSKSERGAEILTTIGSVVAKNITSHPNDASRRLKNLELQNSSVEMLLKSTGEDVSPWQDVLNLLAENWLAEAELSLQYSQSESRGPRMQYDNFGNVFFMNPGQSQQWQGNSGQQIAPIEVGKMIDMLPSRLWQQALNDSIRPRFTSLSAQLYLKVNEEDKAFPFIEALAVPFPEKAHQLAEEFVRVWKRNHNPNSNTRNYGSYMWMYGFQPRAESIPLTRSKQERNLKELSAWVSKLAALPIEPIKEELLADAFTESHSNAEVYRVEAIESVFGSIDQMKPEILGAMAQKMCSNLASIWRDPAIQEQNSTKRKKQDLEAEVLRGYEVARQVVDRALVQHPDHWRLYAAKASLMHDENNYRRELDPDYSFAPSRKAALEVFEQAAQYYANHVNELEEKDYTTDVYDHWFYSALGASELQNVDDSNRLAESQPPLIREALLALPEAAREVHLDRFANNLFSRMSGVKPQVKFRYLQAGLDIVGEHPQAQEARKVYDYYDDLMAEIKLDTVIDGNDQVGHEEPFGVFVNLRHTKEIERESGGFARYLQNQNNMYWAYNYGRPTADYLDKFEESIRAALAEHFEVLSVTFQKDDVKSKAIEPYGWRVTPYAYLLLKARDPKVDRLPPLKVDLDFIDTSGYVVLPIESPPLPLAATGDQQPRPTENAKVTLVLDERQADEGKLLLEAKATANGLVLPIDQLLDINIPGFEVDKVEKQPVAVSRFDPDQQETMIVSERMWTIALSANKGEAPQNFVFPTPRDDAELSEVIYQRYDDADLVQVDGSFALQERYGSTRMAWLWPVFLLAALVVVSGTGFAMFRRQPVRENDTAIQVPEDVTPFSVLGLLRHIDQVDGFSEDGRTRLQGDIHKIERHYFAEDGEQPPDLQSIAAKWVDKVNERILRR